MKTLSNHEKNDEKHDQTIHPKNHPPSHEMNRRSYDDEDKRYHPQKDTTTTTTKTSTTRTSTNTIPNLSVIVPCQIYYSNIKPLPTTWVVLVKKKRRKRRLIMIQGTIQYHDHHHHHHKIDITTTKAMITKYHPSKESNEIRSYETIQIIKY
jgi:hypothetical protein